MGQKPFSVLTRKIKTNLLLKRKQFIVDVVHPGRPNVPRKELQTKLAEIYKIEDPSVIFLFGFRTKFGGGQSSGFGFIYFDITAARTTEPRYRLARNNLLETQRSSGKQRKEQKNRSKKKRGNEKSKIKNTI
mmetsp:Transcript_19064/g.38883  ORF Transcript_19064/g.38883 Transcript_19064/m.38883 type:complete len:132 (-) Transcript_19064:505-900(-)